MYKSGVCDFSFVLRKHSKMSFQTTVKMVYLSFIKLLNKTFVSCISVWVPLPNLKKICLDSSKHPEPTLQGLKRTFGGSNQEELELGVHLVCASKVHYQSDVELSHCKLSQCRGPSRNIPLAAAPVLSVSWPQSTGPGDASQWECVRWLLQCHEDWKITALWQQNLRSVPNPTPSRVFSALPLFRHGKRPPLGQCCSHGQWLGQQEAENLLAAQSNTMLCGEGALWSSRPFATFGSWIQPSHPWEAVRWLM